MSVGTGIAGAMHHQVARPGLACAVCGTAIDGTMKGNPHARAAFGVGVIHACSDTCAARPPFAAPPDDTIVEKIAIAQAGGEASWIRMSFYMRSLARHSARTAFHVATKALRGATP